MVDARIKDGFIWRMLWICIHVELLAGLWVGV